MKGVIMKVSSYSNKWDSIKGSIPLIFQMGDFFQLRKRVPILMHPARCGIYVCGLFLSIANAN